MEHQNRMAIAIVLASIFVGSLASRNTSTPTAFRPGLTNGVDSLTSLGDITTRLVSTLVEAEGEQVDIYGMANFVTALSKAATIVEHPDVSITRFTISIQCFFPKVMMGCIISQGSTITLINSSNYII